MNGDGQQQAASRRPRRNNGMRKTAPTQGRDACLQASYPVARKTVALMLKPEFLDRVGEADYRFCQLPGCEIVYFNGLDGPCFTTQHLRVRVGLKEREDPIPLCYCFDFYEQDIREEVEKTGETTIPQRIEALVEAGMCACPVRNPSGRCCLGEINQTVKALTRTSTRSDSTPNGDA